MPAVARQLLWWSDNESTLFRNTLPDLLYEIVCQSHTISLYRLEIFENTQHPGSWLQIGLQWSNYSAGGITGSLAHLVCFVGFGVTSSG